MGLDELIKQGQTRFDIERLVGLRTQWLENAFPFERVNVWYCASHLEMFMNEVSAGLETAAPALVKSLRNTVRYDKRFGRSRRMTTVIKEVRGDGVTIYEATESNSHGWYPELVAITACALMYGMPICCMMSEEWWTTHIAQQLSWRT